MMPFDGRCKRFLITLTSTLTANRQRNDDATFTVTFDTFMELLPWRDHRQGLSGEGFPKIADAFIHCGLASKD
jgi:hypothetical protein